MKVVILAGGYGTRISEESHLRPKPMIEIGGKPILWHIMKIYSHYGFHDFIICLGYKGEFIKEYFEHYHLQNSDVTFDFINDERILYNKTNEPWKVTLVDTGLDTLTAGRIKKIEKYIQEDNFMMTYGDGVSNINIQKLIEHHNKYNKIATVTAIQPPGRFGLMNINNNNLVYGFEEKPKNDNSWINGGFFVLNKKVFNYIDDPQVLFEKAPLEKIARENELIAYNHDDFWQCMDTLRDKNYLEELWKSGAAPWKIWT